MRAQRGVAHHGWAMPRRFLVETSKTYSQPIHTPCAVAVLVRLSPYSHAVRCRCTSHFSAQAYTLSRQCFRYKHFFDFAYLSILYILNISVLGGVVALKRTEENSQHFQTLPQLCPHSSSGAGVDGVVSVPVQKDCVLFSRVLSAVRLVRYALVRAASS